MPSSTVLIKPNVATAGLRPFPKVWAVNLYSMMGFQRLLSLNYKKCKKSWSVGCTLLLSSIQKRVRLLSKKFLRPVPLSSSLLRLASIL